MVVIVVLSDNYCCAKEYLMKYRMKHCLKPCPVQEYFNALSNHKTDSLEYMTYYGMYNHFHWHLSHRRLCSAREN